MRSKFEKILNKLFGHDGTSLVAKLASPHRNACVRSLLDDNVGVGSLMGYEPTSVRELYCNVPLLPESYNGTVFSLPDCNLLRLATENYFVGLEKPDPILFQQGLEWLIDNATRNERSAWVAVNQRENIGNIAKYPGFGRFAIFHKRGVTRTMLSDCILELVTKFSIPDDGLNRPMLVFHPTIDFLSMLEQVPNIQKMLVIPFLAGEVDNWAKKNFAKDLDNLDLPSIYVDDIAITAFKHLKFAFSETPPESATQYRAALCQTLQILIQNGIRFEPQALQSALIQRCGWGPVSSKQTAELAEIFLSEHIPAGYDGHGPWDPGIFKLWRIEAAKTQAK